MIQDFFVRTGLLLGTDALERLRHAHVAVFGVGGVGSYVVEALARCGVGALDLIDDDVVDTSNINRQLIATARTLGMRKVDVARERIREINPDCEVGAFACRYDASTAQNWDLNRYDYIVDAIDSLASKLQLVLATQVAQAAQVAQVARATQVAQAAHSAQPTQQMSSPHPPHLAQPPQPLRSTPPTQPPQVSIISCMGTGCRLDPSAFCVADIYETHTDPLARRMRKECRAAGVASLKVVFSVEKPCAVPQKKAGGLVIPSISFVPASAGLLIASEVVRDLIQQ